MHSHSVVNRSARNAGRCSCSGRPRRQLGKGPPRSNHNLVLNIQPKKLVLIFSETLKGTGKRVLVPFLHLFDLHFLLAFIVFLLRLFPTAMITAGH